MAYLNEAEWAYDEVRGIYTAKDIVTATAFDDAIQEGLRAIEDDSWWFEYRAEVILRLMERYFRKDRMTLDIGGGNGYTSGKAQQNGWKMGIIEPNPKACLNAEQRGISEVCCGAVTESSVLDSSVYQMTLLDVLEHIEDDEGFLKLLCRKLVPGGRLLITVPAFRCLWSSEDNVAGHFRRYRIRELSRLVKKCGFRVSYRSYFMGYLFLPILFVRVFMERIGLLKPQQERSDSERKRIADVQFRKRSGITSAVLRLLQSVEKSLMKKSDRVPFGSSIILAAKKK